MTAEETILAINSSDDAITAAVIAFSAISEFSDFEMGDGDSARHVADAWLSKWRPPE
jgi:hypothetical protein